MTKPVIVTRLGKGSELTFQEGDDNFTNLRDATINISADSGSTQNVELNGTIQIAGGTGVSTAADNGVVTITGFDGDYSSLSNKPELFDGDYNSLSNTPSLATVATSGAYSDLSGTPSLATVATSGAYSDLSGTPSLATVATSGAYSDLSGPPSLATVATSGSYTDLTDKPTIPTNNNELTNGAGYITGIDSSAVTTALGFTPENSANKNANNGYAGLDANGLVPASILPSYVDDVLEFADVAAFPATGETGKIFVAVDTGKIYRWSGSAYVEISASPGSTDAVTEGTVNLYFTTQRARDAFSASTGITITNGAIATTITQYTDSDARQAVSVSTGTASGGGSLSYNNTTGVFSFTPAEQGAQSLSGLTDTTITSPATNNVLRYDGTSWINTAQTNLSVGSATSATNATNATNITQNTTTTNTTYYPLLSNSSSSGIRTPVFDTRVAFIRTAGAIQLDLGTSGDIEGQIRLWSNDGGSTNITGGTSSSNLTFRLPSNAGSSGQVLSTNGSGTLSWVTRATSSGVTSVSGTGTVNGLTLTGTVTTTGSLTLGGTLSNIANSALANSSITINGTAVSLGGSTTIATGIASVSADTTPQLGGNLNVAGNSIVSVSDGNIVIAPNGTGRTVANRLNYNEAVHSLGTTSGTIAPDVANGNVQTITLNGNLTLNAFTNPVVGQSITLIVNTGGTGRTLTSTMKWAGGEKTLSTTNTTDIISIFYDGTNYWASLSKDFK
jgi:hypothetical protein